MTPVNSNMSGLATDTAPTTEGTAVAIAEAGPKLAGAAVAITVLTVVMVTVVARCAATLS